jgi:hypothetical protein
MEETGKCGCDRCWSLPTTKNRVGMSTLLAERNAKYSTHVGNSTLTLLISRHNKIALSFNRNNPPPKIQIHKINTIKSIWMEQHIFSL